MILMIDATKHLNEDDDYLETNLSGKKSFLHIRDLPTQKGCKWEAGRRWIVNGNVGKSIWIYFASVHRYICVCTKIYFAFMWIHVSTLFLKIFIDINMNSFCIYAKIYIHLSLLFFRWLFLKILYELWIYFASMCRSISICPSSSFFVFFYK